VLDKLKAHAILFFLLFLTIPFIYGCSNGNTGSESEIVSTARPAQLKLTCIYGTNVPILGDNVVYLAKRVEQASAGNIKFKLFDPGKLVGPMEILDVVSSGKIEAGYSTPGFWMGMMPAAPLFSAIPFGPDTSEYLAWFLAGNGMKLYQEMYDRSEFNVKVLLMAIIPPESSGWFSEKIESVEDLNGLKMRFFGLGGRVMQKLGVSVNILPGGEIFSALEKKVIDATEFSMPVIDENMGFHKLAKYNYFPGWHQQATAFELLINKDVWNNLSSTQQVVIEMACRDTIVHSIATGEASQAAVLQRNEMKHGVKILSWQPEIIEAYREKWLEVVEEQTAADPFFKKVWEDYSDFRKQYAIWGSKAYLPRSR